MLRFCLFAFLAFGVSWPLNAADASKAPKKQELSVERFFSGTDADRDAMLKMIAPKGYHDVAVVPWFVLMAKKNSRGREVLLLVDPISLQAMEIQNESDEMATAPETVAPKPRD
jgi:hypothetical protein